jgi:branched-chain amino acid transport system ATP-binding protein
VTAAGAPLLEVADLDVRYGDFQALFGVSLAVAEGGALALVGANGAGKSTLLRSIAGAHPPAAGRVVYQGDEVTGLPAREKIQRGIALVPEGRRLFPSLTAEENILVGTSATGGGESWSLERIYETFPLIAACRRRRAALLSGGEQQAVAIARALASGPRLLLLDEISLGLAPRIVAELYETLVGLRAAGTTLVVVEQDLDRALDACDDFVCLLEGRVALAGPTAGAERGALVSAYFGHDSVGHDSSGQEGSR